MSAFHRSRGISRFALIWVLVIVCLAIVWAAVLTFLTVALEEYESVQPCYAAENIFETYFKNASGEELAEYLTTESSVFEDSGNKAEYIKSVIESGALSFKEVFSSDSSQTLYAVSAGDVTFASFTVVDGTQKTEILGLTFPALGKITVNLKPLYGAVIYAPIDAEVRVNGNLLDESCIEGEKVVLSDAVYFPDENENSRVMVNYSVSGLYAEPEISVKYTITSGSSLCTEKNPGTSEHELTLSENEGVYSAELSYLTLLADRYNEKILIAEEKRLAEEERKRLEEEEKEKERQRISDEIKAVYEPFILEMSRQYNDFIYYSTRKSQQDLTKVYFKPGTEIYNYITLGSYGGYYNWSDFRPYVNGGMSFKDEETSYYEWLDEEHTKFKCRISLMCCMVGKNSETGLEVNVEEPFKMTAYVDVSGEKPLVYELVTTESDLAKETN